MLTQIDHISLAQYETDGTINLTDIPIHAYNSSLGFVYVSAGTSFTLPTEHQMIIIKSYYHNTLEDEDPYYRVTTYWNYDGSDASVWVNAGSYVYIASIEDGVDVDYMYVFVTKDDEVIMSLPEANTLSGEGCPAAHIYLDYDDWRISPQYMPHLDPST